MEKQRYVLQASKDGQNWKSITAFEEGQLDRNKNPFNADGAIQEALLFLQYWKKEGKWNFVRIIIEL
jgi:hypothetical protein